MDLKNTVIKVINREHGQKVRAFFEENGVDTTGFDFIHTEEAFGSNSFIYYGLFNKKFNNITINTVKSSNLKIIELPMNTIKIGDETIDLTLTFPRKMYVSNNPITHLKSTDIRTVLIVSTAGGSKKVIAVANRNTSFNVIDNICLWQYCKELPPVKKMTVAEIEEKLGHGVEVIS